jgi:hypothetical protein
MNYSVYQNHTKNIKQTRDFSAFFSSHGLRIFLTVLAFVLLILYVVRLSTVSIKGYDISALQKEVNVLQSEQERLEFEIAKNGSMQNIQARLKNATFVPVEQPEFASLDAPIIAHR